jgi:tetratricopeptide (TPR) repeat protein
MRYPNVNASPAASSWPQHKQQARDYYESGQYEEALASYRAALNPEYECPAIEAQILRSNVVACRLKLGGDAQAAAAVQDAKQCIALNPAWAKGHVRLASAYIALGGGHSNDACNALQTALRLDPSNQLARQMLMRELRRDHTTTDTTTPSAPPEEEDDDIAGSQEDNTGDAAFRQRPQPQPQDEPQYRDQAPVDDSLSLRERIQFYTIQVRSWYQAQNEQFKLALGVMLVVLALYVAFGGRFGLDSTPTRRGNYGTGNAYDQYRKSYSTSTSYNSYNYRDNSNSNSNSNTQRPRRTSSSSFQWSSLDGGSLAPLIMMAGAVYLMYRNGVNPVQALMIVNMFAGGRGRRRGFNPPMGGMGWGGGGMRWGGRGRRGGRW